VVILFKLNFEKAVILVIILILLISSTNIYTQFIDLIFPEKTVSTIQASSVKDMSFPAMLLQADQLYKEGKYREAQSEYLKIVNMPTLSSQQKAVAYFKLGLCNYNLKLYDIAFDSFAKSASFNTSDAIAYNNAAVCAFLAGDTNMAESYQKKAIASLPAVEFYYNIGRVYESQKKYEDAAKYYLAAIKGEDNITRIDSIDPVRIKNKVIRLFPEKSVRDELSKDFLIALKLKDIRDVLIINDKEMDIKEDFSLKFQQVNGMNRIQAKYDRKAMDPYHLINSLKWTVKCKNKIIYVSEKDEFSLNVQENEDYEVILAIRYNGTKEVYNKKYINKKQVTDNKGQGREQSYKPTGEVCKYYVYADYEQVFENSFALSSKGFTDRFNVVWGKDNIKTEIMSADFIDAGSSLDILNDSSSNAGIWADMTDLLQSKELKGKTITVKFYARKITHNVQAGARLRVKADQIYNEYKELELDYKWKQFSMSIYIPPDSTSLTFSLDIKPGDEIKIDGFIISTPR